MSISLREELIGSHKAAWDAVRSTGRYKAGFDDCSNNAFELWYWWMALENDCKIMLVHKKSVGLHAQVESRQGIYDPTSKRRTKKSKDKIGTLGELGQDTTKGVKLPSGFEFEEYISFNNIMEFSEFVFPTRGQYALQRSKIIRDAPEIVQLKLLNEDRRVNGKSLKEYLKFGRD